MNSLIQYFKDTRGELRHVAWPTQTQTVVYTIFVATLSVLTALYLGLFDYIFTSGLGAFVQNLPATAPGVDISQIEAATSTATSTINFGL